MYRLDRICFDEAFRFSRRAMRRFAEASDAIAVVAEASTGDLAGFAIAEEQAGALYVVTLDVAPDYRRHGLGRQMLRWLEDQAPNVRWMGLHVFAKNAAAISFYEREGFVCVRREANFYAPGMDAIVYRREIARVTPTG